VRHRAPDHASDGEDAGAKGVTDKVRQQVKEQEREIHDMLSAPGKMQRIKDGLLHKLPYHRQFWSAGTVFDGTLDEPVDFGEADEVAPLDGLSPPPPNTVLSARLTTKLDSSLSVRGTPVTASLTVPVFSADHRLLLPEGTVLTGEVTKARPARHFRHNGQLRFLILSVARPSNSEQALLASLHSVDATSTDSLEIDSEGGAAMTNPKPRFVAPALSVLSLLGSVNQHTEGADEPGDVATLQNNTGAQTTGGFIGFGLIGAAIGWVSRPAAIAFSADKKLSPRAYPGRRRRVVMQPAITVKHFAQNVLKLLHRSGGIAWSCNASCCRGGCRGSADIEIGIQGQRLQFANNPLIQKIVRSQLKSFAPLPLPFPPAGHFGNGLGCLHGAAGLF
jgi:hypothetical protein